MGSRAQNGSNVQHEIHDNIELRPESERIQFLLMRDGPEPTRAWVQRTLEIYRQTLQHGDSMYRERFEQAVREFEEWLATQAR